MKRQPIKTKLHYWWIAVKPPALGKIALPTLVGTGMACAGGYRTGWWAWAAVLLFIVLAELVIVLLNDYADRYADALHRRLFPHLLEPRVIVESWLRPVSVLWAGGLAVAGLAALGFLLGYWGQRPWALILFGLGCALLWAYSFPPLKLNYRGYGEGLESLGVGLVLPLTGYYLLSGAWAGFRPAYCAPLLCLALVSALASGLKHEPGDRASGKRTWAVRYGSAATRRLILGLQSMAVLGCLALSAIWGWSLWLLVLGVGAPLWTIRQSLIWQQRAQYEDPAALSVYKRWLNRGYQLTCLGLVLEYIHQGSAG